MVQSTFGQIQGGGRWPKLEFVKSFENGLIFDPFEN